MYKVGHHSLSHLSVWPPLSQPTPRKHISQYLNRRAFILTSHRHHQHHRHPQGPSSHFPPCDRGLLRQTLQAPKATLSGCASNIPYRIQTAPTSSSSSLNALPRSPHHTRSALMDLRAPRPISTKVLADVLDARAGGTHILSLTSEWATPGLC